MLFLIKSNPLDPRKDYVIIDDFIGDFMDINLEDNGPSRSLE